MVREGEDRWRLCVVSRLASRLLMEKSLCWSKRSVAAPSRPEVVYYVLWIVHTSWLWQRQFTASEAVSSSWDKLWLNVFLVSMAR